MRWVTSRSWAATPRSATATSRAPTTQRLADLNDALRDPEVDAVWCIRGGYGITRILDRVDFDALARPPEAAHRLLRHHRPPQRGHPAHRRRHLPRAHGARRDAGLQPAALRAGARVAPSRPAGSGRLPEPPSVLVPQENRIATAPWRRRRGAAGGRQPHAAPMPDRHAPLPRPRRRDPLPRGRGRGPLPGGSHAGPSAHGRARSTASPASPSAGSPSSSAR